MLSSAAYRLKHFGLDEAQTSSGSLGWETTNHRVHSVKACGPRHAALTDQRWRRYDAVLAGCASRVEVVCRRVSADYLSLTRRAAGLRRPRAGCVHLVER